ncbi:MAG: ComF family protein [Oscillospiraceae bacterium]|nr:ComF family protein [Oscillospiraceae bacterium]
MMRNRAVFSRACRLGRMMPYRSAIRNFFFPKVCVFCGGVPVRSGRAKADSLCEDLSVCAVCLALLPFKLFTAHEIPCLSNAYESDPIPGFSVLVPFRYEGEIVSALRALKFNDAPYIARTLGYFMATSAYASGRSFDAVIPVPLSTSRLRRRGYNQAALLATEISGRLELPCLECFLIRTRSTRQQSRFVDPGLRAANVRGAFAVPEEASVEGLRILLVDDVFTTGNTLHEAALALFRAGAADVTAVTTASGRDDDNEKGFMTSDLSGAKKHRFAR